MASHGQPADIALERLSLALQVHVIRSARQHLTTLDAVAPAMPLREFVRSYEIRRERHGSGAVRPITARIDVALVFHLRGNHEAFEYLTGRRRRLPSALLVGPQRARRADLWTTGDVDSIVVWFQPGGFHRLFHAPVNQFTDFAWDAADVLGPELRDVHLQLSTADTPCAQVAALDEFLLSRVTEARALDGTVHAATALRARHGRLRVSDAIRLSGLSARQFERRFAEQLGLSPKLYARIARLDFAVALKDADLAMSWADISQEAGYYDQMHLVKDFKRLTGCAPSTFSQNPHNLEG